MEFLVQCPYFSGRIWSSRMLCCPSRAGGVSYGRSSITAKCADLLQACPFFFSAILFLECGGWRVTAQSTEHWPPSSFREYAMDMDVDSMDEWRRKIDRRIAQMDFRYGSAGGIGRNRRRKSWAFGSRAGRSNGYWAEEMHGGLMHREMVSAEGGIYRTTFRGWEVIVQGWVMRVIGRHVADGIRRKTLWSRVKCGQFVGAGGAIAIRSWRSWSNGSGLIAQFSFDVTGKQQVRGFVKACGYMGLKLSA